VDGVDGKEESKSDDRKPLAKSSETPSPVQPTKTHVVSYAVTHPHADHHREGEVPLIAALAR
jgi:hypothetical protein